jgi:hypothetical protein
VAILFRGSAKRGKLLNYYNLSKLEQKKTTEAKEFGDRLISHIFLFFILKMRVTINFDKIKNYTCPSLIISGSV